MEHLQRVSDSNYHPNGYIERKFEVNNPSVVESLVKDYRDNFAFGIKYKGNKYTLMKIKDYQFKRDDGTPIQEDGLFIRNDKNHKFEFPKDPDPVTNVYCLKTNSIQDIIDFILN
jgi:hypothetical protein